MKRFKYKQKIKIDPAENKSALMLPALTYRCQLHRSVLCHSQWLHYNALSNGDTKLIAREITAV